MAVIKLFGTSTGTWKGLGDLYVRNPPTWDGLYESNVQLAQSFVPADTYQVETVILSLSRLGYAGSSLAGSTVVSIHADTPGGEEVGSASIVRTTVTVKAEFTFTFAEPPTVTNGETYYVVLTDDASTEDPDGTDDRIRAWGSTAGNQIWSKDDGPYDAHDWALGGLSLQAFFGTVNGTVIADLPSKATNPTPANAATEVDFSTPTLDWDGDGDSYNIYAGGGGNWALIEEGLEATIYTMTSSEKAFCRCYDSATGVRWRIDSVNAEGVILGDVWEFNPRPGVPTNPTPGIDGTDISISDDMAWDAGTNADTYDLWIAGSKILSDTGDVTYALTEDLFTWSGVYSWRVDPSNYFGITEGTEWSFTALSLDPVISTWTTIADTGEDGWTGEGPLAGGVEGLDFRWTGLNNVTTLKRLIVITKDRLYYEGL